MSSGWHLPSGLQRRPDARSCPGPTAPAWLQESTSVSVSERSGCSALPVPWLLPVLPAPPPRAVLAHEPYSVGVGSNQIASHLKGEACLATPTRPRQGQQPRHDQIALEIAQLGLSADEAAPISGQVVLGGVWDPSGGEARVRPSASGKRPVVISSLRARLEAAGSVPSVLERVSSSRPYCAIASSLFPTRAYRRINPACASSRVGSSDTTLPSASMAES